MTSTGTSERRLALDLLGDAAQRLTRTVDGFHGDDWRTASLLPGWTRAHVVAHLALNAEGVTRVIRALVGDEPSDEPPTMYDSDERRDSDILDLGERDPGEIRDRLLGGTTVLHDAFAAVPEDGWGGRVERTPGGRSLPVSALPSMRVREIEIHHVDLGADYTTAGWPEPFSVLLLDAMTKRLRPDDPFEVKPLDSERTWVVGRTDSEYPVPIVTGPAADLGWWLTGRPAPETLSCSRGELPEIGAW